MSKETFCEAEERRFEKLKNVGLPHSFKKIGVGVVVISILLMISNKFLELEMSETIKFFGKRLILVGLLIVAISREKVEDEMIRTIRGQAFSMAFITGIIYTLIHPAIYYFASLIKEIDKKPLDDVGDFQVLWFMLTMYLLFFYMIKRKL